MKSEKCELCEEPVMPLDMAICDKCGEGFGPCCTNETNSDYCIECDPPESDE
jgi:hypothetical protein